MSVTEHNIQCKVVLAGDSFSGKSSLLRRFASDSFSQVYKPTGFDRYAVKHKLNGNQNINFIIWDTSGSTAYNNVRPLAYNEAEIVLLCFQIGASDSLFNILNKWHPEIRKYSSYLPVVLCGCQFDRRLSQQHQNLSLSHISPEKALSVSRRISAVTYVETSAKISSKSVSNAFEMTALAAMGKLNQSSCFQRDFKIPKQIGINEAAMYEENNSDIDNQSKNCSMM